MSLTTHSLGQESSHNREQRRLCCQSFWCGQDRVHALNLSSGGMCLRIDRRVNPGEIVELHLGPQLKVNARVAWTRQLAACTEFGVQFLDTLERIRDWTAYFTPAKEEPMLALPAPEHTFRPANPVGSSRSGKSWQTAFRIINR